MRTGSILIVIVDGRQRYWRNRREALGRTRGGLRLQSVLECRVRVTQSR
jgi:hypothetical protein